MKYIIPILSIGIGWIAAAAQPTVLSLAANGPAGLTLREEENVLTVRYSGRIDALGIPSWRAVVRRDDAGNLSGLYVPADDPRPLSARADQWPLAVIASSNDVGVTGTMSRGRENFGLFHVSTFQVVEKAVDKIVVKIGGTSKNKHFEHSRTYTFTPVGIKMEGVVRALIDLKEVGIWTHWDRR